MTNDHPTEIWRQIPNFPEYSISNLGRVRRDAPRSTSRRTDFVPLIRRPDTNHSGYHVVNLCQQGLYTRKSVHSLVALTFIGERPDGYQINHKDGNKINNRVENLEYVTPRDNSHHAIATGLWPMGSEHWTRRRPHRVAHGERANKSNLTEQDVKLIRSRYKAGGCTQRSLAKEYGVTQRAIWQIVSYTNWRHLT